MCIRNVVFSETALPIKLHPKLVDSSVAEKIPPPSDGLGEPCEVVWLMEEFEMVQHMFCSEDKPSH